MVTGIRGGELMVHAGAPVPARSSSLSWNPWPRPHQPRRCVAPWGLGRMPKHLGWAAKQMGEERAWVCPGPEILMHPSAGAQAAPESGLPSFRWVGERTGWGGGSGELQPANAPTVPGGWGLRVPPASGISDFARKNTGHPAKFQFHVANKYFFSRSISRTMHRTYLDPPCPVHLSDQGVRKDL